MEKSVTLSKQIEQHQSELRVLQQSLELAEQRVHFAETTAEKENTRSQTMDAELTKCNVQNHELTRLLQIHKEDEDNVKRLLERSMLENKELNNIHMDLLTQVLISLK